MIEIISRLMRRWRNDETGQSLLEFALSSIVFLLTILGTIDFGRAIWQYNMVSDLAQEGARYAAVHGMNGTSPTSATQSQVESYVQSRALGFNVTVTMTPSTVGAQGSTITVQVQSPFVPATGLMTSFAMTLQSTAQMIVQR